MKKGKLIGKIFAIALVGLMIGAMLGGLPTTNNELTVNAAGSHLTYTVYATREGSVGGTTANGHVIVSHDHFVALPSTKVLCSNGGHEYEVKVTYNGKSVIAPVWDVGPWNTKDNYWDSPSQREMWQDLPQGKPEAQAAYQDGYNGGFDETNYLVKASTGSDEFSVGDRVQPTVNGLKVRSTAGGVEIGSVLTSDKGTVIGGPQKIILNGLYYRWWNITWDKGFSGWSAQKRYVSNPAGIDLADGTFWDDLGMTDNDWVTVEFLWTTAEDTTPPAVDAFSVIPSSVTSGNAFTISYTVSDTGGSGLGWIQLWRKYETASWEQVDSTTLSGVGNGPYSGSFSDTPLTVGTYWYGIHVGDDAGNWVTEGDSGFSPIEVEVIQAAPVTIYVPDNYSTIQAAVNAANPGDTIIVRAGTYTENVDVNKDHLTIQSESGAETTIVQAANPNDHVFEVTADYVTIKGFTVEGATASEGNGVAGICLRAGHSYIVNNICQNNYHGIFLYSSSSNALENNTCSANYWSGILLSFSSDNILKDNTCSGSAYFGIALHSSSNNALKTNTCSGNSYYGMGVSFHSNNNTLENNTCSGNNYGICLQYSSENNIVKNNTCSGSVFYGILFYYSSNSSAYLNNFVGNAYDGGSTDSTNIWSSPGEFGYTYKGKTYMSYVGNYWSDYAESDADGDGIGETPYPIDSDADNYPLVEPFENYGIEPSPRTWYVDDDLADYPDADFTKIQDAVDAVSPGDTIIVYPGTYTENVDVNKDHLTIQSEKEAETTIVQAANPDDHVFDVMADYVNISGFTAENANSWSKAGIYLSEVAHCIISNNHVTNNGDGILLDHSSNNVLENNTASNNKDGGIALWESNNNTLENNNLLNNFRGICLGTNSTGNILENNNFRGDGLWVYDSYGNTVENNTVNGKPLVYLEDASDQTIMDMNAGQVILVNCDNITVKNLDISNTTVGIELLRTNNSEIENNTVNSNNEYGIWLYGSKSNVLKSNIASDNNEGIVVAEGTAGESGNNKLESNIASSNYYCGIELCGSSGNDLMDCTVSNNGRGFYLFCSDNNKLISNTMSDNDCGILLGSSNSNKSYFNNFINNTSNIDSSSSTNTWHSLEPITYTYNGTTYTNYLGNYWSDYTGSDANGDGIGETPYPIDSDADNYPLVEPFEDYVPIGYAILVAGQSGWSTRLAINYNANNAYRVLRNLGYDDDRILYLNSNFPQDVDDDGYDEVDASSSLNDFIDAIEWAKQRVNRDAPFVLYLIGHGCNDPAIFFFDEPGADGITPSHLNNLLEAFPEQTPMFIGIDACYSGSFITPGYGTISLPDRCRVILTSAHDDQKKWAAVIGRLFFSDDFWRNLHRGLNVKDAFVQTGDVTYSWLDDNGDAVGHPPNLLEDDGKLAERIRIGSPGIENIPLKPFTLAELFSPGELRIYDSQGRVTGLVNGEVIEEIPNSMYDSENEAVVVFDEIDNYYYEVVGIDTGNYGLVVASTETGDEITFTATDIPTTSGAVHQYAIDWDALAEGEEGVTVHVDSDGDGITDYTLKAGNVLTGDEFIPQFQGCFIATAAYGTPMAEEIEILREFRDKYLLSNPLGQALVDFYYKASPPIAEFITEHPSLKPIVRTGLMPAVVMSTVVVNTTPAEKIAIIGLLALVSVALAIWVTRRRGRGPEYS